MPLRKYPLFTQLCNVEAREGKGFAIARSAGSYSLLISKTDKLACIKLRSGWQIKINLNLFAVNGIAANNKFKFIILGSAGAARARGFKSKVRGVAKNPCDHPHGGGNGKKAKPVNPVSAWGKFAKNTPTKLKQYHYAERRKFKILSNKR